MFCLKIAVPTLLTLFSSALVHATILSRQFVVISPKITKPDASSIWQVGSVQTVTWNTDVYVHPPYKLANPNAQIILGFIGDGDGLHLDLDHPLAKGFKLLDGSVRFTVPNLPPRDDYILVVFGSARSPSPPFSIIANPSAGNSTSSSFTSTSSTQGTSSLQSASSTLSSSTASGSSSTSATGGSSSASASSKATGSSVAQTTATDSSVAQTQSALASNTPTSPVPTPTPANTGAGTSNHGSLNKNMFIFGMVSTLALIVS